MGLNTPGDYIEYDIKVENLGSLDAVISGITRNPATDDNPAIKFTMSGLNVGDKVRAANATNSDEGILTVRIEYDASVTSQPQNTNSSITITIIAQQDLGQLDPVTYAAYSIGNKITYRGADWYVIENSDSSQDYVTLMKETTLTGQEIGDAYSAKHTCTESDVNQNLYDCTSTGQTINNIMAYYWSSTCHNQGTYGTDVYESSDTSGCSGHNDYAGSKIKLALESYMTNYLDASELKTGIGNYKIRLIGPELLTNLGFVATGNSTKPFDSSSITPSWIRPPAVADTVLNAYWTLINDPYDNTNKVLAVVRTTEDSSMSGFSVSAYGLYGGRINLKVRPVINLLKTAIPSQE